MNGLATMAKMAKMAKTAWDPWKNIFKASPCTCRGCGKLEYFHKAPPPRMRWTPEMTICTATNIRTDDLSEPHLCIYYRQSTLEDVA